MDLFEYLAFRAFAAFVGVLPLKTALSLGVLVGKGAYMVPLRRKSLALENLRLSLGDEKSEAELEAILKGMYVNTGMSLVEFARLGRVDEEYVNRHVSFEGFTEMDAALNEGKGVVLLTAHFGNWELLSAALALKGYRLSAVARPLDNKYFDVYTRTQRESRGNSVIDRSSGLRKMLGVIKDNGILGILLDQRTSRKEAVEVEFFGRKAPTSKGLAAIVAKTGTPVLPVFIVRTGGADHKIVCEKPIELASTDDDKRDIIENTQKFTEAIEQMIRIYPDHWFWFHSRWSRRKDIGYK